MKKNIPIISYGLLLTIVAFGFFQISSKTYTSGHYVCCDNGPPYGTDPWNFSRAEMFGGYTDYDTTVGGKGYLKISTCISLWEEGNFYNCENCTYYQEVTDVEGWDCWHSTHSNIHDCGWYYDEIMGPVLSISENDTYFNPGQTTISSCFTVDNVGYSTLTWSTYNDNDWISNISPSNEEVDEGDPCDDVLVSVDRTQLTANQRSSSTKTGHIHVSANGQSEDVEITVEISAPSTPTNLVMTNKHSWGQAPVLTWDDVSMEAKYKVYRQINTGSWVKIAEPGMNVTTYTDYGITQTKDNCDNVYYRVTAWNGGGESSPSNIVSTLGSAQNEVNKEETALDIKLKDDGTLPNEYSLLNSYPNPGNPGTTITYKLPESGHVTLRVFNVRGEIIRTLVDHIQSAGTHKIYWDGCNDQGNGVGTGMYIFILNAGGKTFHQKYSLIK